MMALPYKQIIVFRLFITQDKNMPKTIIKRKTWGCTCLWNTDNPEWEGRDCPNCGKPNGIQRETDPNRMGTLTIMGEEDVELEIEREDEERTKKGETKRTEAEKTVYRTKRKQDIVEAIVRAKLLEDK